MKMNKIKQLSNKRKANMLLLGITILSLTAAYISELLR